MKNWSSPVKTRVVRFFFSHRFRIKKEYSWTRIKARKQKRQRLRPFKISLIYPVEKRDEKLVGSLI